jgi:anaerobic magnesium-protoporphyrin IX monomethyl ester cyclase
LREETDRDFLRGLIRIVAYGPDQINAMYVTPHRWTPFYRENVGRRVVEVDQSNWDYRHQVLAAGVPSWRVFLWMKLTEAAVQLRPGALWPLVSHRDREVRKILRWCFRVGCRAWFFEVRSFLSRIRRKRRERTLSEYWAAYTDTAEEDA